MESSKTGRRPGTPQTREAILEAAIASFVESGYAATTIRGVARAADVDPALVMHFFGSKDSLFDAALRGAMPVQELAVALAGDVSSLGERLTRRYLEVWESPETGPRIRAIVGSIASTPAAAQIMRDFMSGELATPLAKSLPGDQPERRAILAAAQLMGMAFARYLLAVEPMASMTTDELVISVGPSVQRYLTGDLG
ncbi:TetR family transcriptional regulator [Herbidospora sp. NBRC 101105]|uniref:TetR/AcrR family transcriptional regulator n=1 Tax=Herbidospora sp. NBRC 101105 TaxID=3032195 RepID=UPI0024A45DF9|nr:TetR family transcriptional regulator [Herbidospora sp. NBRC 101105]GLX96043.1 TetR family transcriptional regulator [Herbidospora sp. NBRC 101105]